MSCNQISEALRELIAGLVWYATLFEQLSLFLNQFNDCTVQENKRFTDFFSLLIKRRIKWQQLIHLLDQYFARKKTYRKREYFSTLRTPKKRTFQQK